jgi:hypothetical protein
MRGGAVRNQPGARCRPDPQRRDRGAVRPEAGRCDRVGQARRLDDHHQRVYRHRGRLRLPPAACGQLPRLGPGARFRGEQGQCRSQCRAAPELHAAGNRRCRAALSPAPGRDDGRSVARGDAAGRAHEEDIHEQLHRVPLDELRTAVPVRRSRLEQDHRPDENGAQQRRLSRAERQTEPDHGPQPEAACGVPRARTRSGRVVDESRVASAADRRGGARGVDAL